MADDHPTGINLPPSLYLSTTHPSLERAMHNINIIFFMQSLLQSLGIGIFELVRSFNSNYPVN